MVQLFDSVHHLSQVGLGTGYLFLELELFKKGLLITTRFFFFFDSQYGLQYEGIVSHSEGEEVGQETSRDEIRVVEYGQEVVVLHIVILYFFFAFFYVMS